MNIAFKGTKYEPTPEILAQAKTQLENIARYLGADEALATASVELERAVGNQKQGDIWRAEINIDHHGNRFRAESTKTKLDHAITTAVRDVGREIRRARGKNQHMFKKGHAAIKNFIRGFSS